MLWSLKTPFATELFGSPIVVRAMEREGIADIRLSAQRALWGCVPNSLRAFSACISGKTIIVRAIFDETVTEKDKELLSEAASEIIADYVEPYSIKEECLVIPVGQSMEHLESLIFLRHEL